MRVTNPEHLISQKESKQNLQLTFDRRLPSKFNSSTHVSQHSNTQNFVRQTTSLSLNCSHQIVPRFALFKCELVKQLPTWALTFSQEQSTHLAIPIVSVSPCEVSFLDIGGMNVLFSARSFMTRVAVNPTL